MLNIAYIADASEQVHFQAKLVLLLLFLRRINSKISKQSTKSDRGYILRLVRFVLIRGDMATQYRGQEDEITNDLTTNMISQQSSSSL